MSNLGAYQKMTTYAKKCGGPLRLGALIFAGGAALGGAAVILYQKITREIEEKGSKKKLQIVELTIKKDGTSNDEVRLKKGDKIRILGQVDGAVLIEVIGAKDNPYFVDVNFLKEISDYREEKKSE